MKFKLTKLRLFLIIITAIVLSTLGFTIKEHFTICVLHGRFRPPQLHRTSFNLCAMVANRRERKSVASWVSSPDPVSFQHGKRTAPQKDGYGSGQIY